MALLLIHVLPFTSQELFIVTNSLTLMNSSVPIEIRRLKYKRVRYIWRSEYADTSTERKYPFIAQNEEVTSQTT
jgi:hypothetical protein